MTSSGNILDNEEVEFLLSSALDDGAGGDDDATPEQAVTMRGDLDQINLSDIFQTLSMTKMEGVLRVHNPLEQRQVFCRDGYIRILVPTRVIHRRIGQRLVHCGLITGNQLRSALMRQRKQRLPLGQLLVDDGLLTAEAIDDIASTQVAEDLFELFTWRHGTFEFYKGPVEDPALRSKFDDCHEFEVSGLLLEVARRSDEWESVLDTIHGLDEVPARTEVETPTELTEIHAAVLAEVDGATTYRQLASRTPHGVFEVARAARDLVRNGFLENIGQDEMVAVARGLADTGSQKQAVMLLQTLRDRPGECELETVRGIAAVLDKCGERRLAGLTLLEYAQQNDESEIALTLARDACTYAPRDPETLSFLRTTLLVHSAADSAELAQCTQDLLDALLECDRLDTALEIATNARATGSATAEIVLREARIRQRNRDANGAIAVLEELAQSLRTQGQKERLKEVYETILKIDRSRSDIRKLLLKTRRSKGARMVRLAITLATAGLLGTIGFSYWQQQQAEVDAATAAQEISDLLGSGDRLAARERLEFWSGVLGLGETTADLRRQIDFADAAEMQRRARLLQKQMVERLAAAWELLRKGDLNAAFAIYTEVRASRELRTDADESLATRL
ncbi:MAG: DUF4388 domain-containing protein, partial [Planctomycetes bacterium]|nr:DUF4388 domain-containing protein [Planctomycetota bacterium]